MRSYRRPGILRASVRRLLHAAVEGIAQQLIGIVGNLLALLPEDSDQWTWPAAPCRDVAKRRRPRCVPARDHRLHVRDRRSTRSRSTTRTTSTTSTRPRGACSWHRVLRRERVVLQQRVRRRDRLLLLLPAGQRRSMSSFVFDDAQIIFGRCFQQRGHRRRLHSAPRGK